MSVNTKQRRFELRVFLLPVVLNLQVLLLLTVASTPTLNNTVAIATGPTSASVTGTITAISIITITANNSL